MRKTQPKSDRIGLRISPRNKLGLEVLAVRHGLTVSTLVEKAVEELLKRENLTTVPNGELVSLLDRLLPLPPGARLIEMSKRRSDLLSPVDRVWLAALEGEEKRLGHTPNPEDVERFYEEHWGAWE